MSAEVYQPLLNLSALMPLRASREKRNDCANNGLRYRGLLEIRVLMRPNLVTIFKLRSADIRRVQRTVRGR